MTVRELIEELEKIDENEKDLPIAIWNDGWTTKFDLYSDKKEIWNASGTMLRTVEMIDFN